MWKIITVKIQSVVSKLFRGNFTSGVLTVLMPPTVVQHVAEIYNSTLHSK